MLVADLDGTRILITDPAWAGRQAELRLAAGAGRLRAPCCGELLVLKWGARKTRHFAHRPGAACPYERYAEPESAAHVAGKERLYRFCQAYFAGRLRRCELEFPLPDTGLRPDVYVELADGTRLALEYQRADPGEAGWAERHHLYAAAGVADIWVLGENHLPVLPPDKAARWTGGEAGLVTLRPRAFAAAAARPTPWDAPAWRPTRQPSLWLELHHALRVGLGGAALWYDRPAVRAAGSLYVLDAGTGRLTILRAVHPAPGYAHVRLATPCAAVDLAPGQVDLGPAGFWTAADTGRRQDFEARRGEVEAALPAYRAGQAHWREQVVREQQETYQAELPALAQALSTPMPPGCHPEWRERARARRRWLERAAARGRPAPGALAPFHLPVQETRQREWGEGRPDHPLWQGLKHRYRLTQDNLSFLCGVPIPDDTVFPVHRSVWQAYILYRAVYRRRWRTYFQAEFLVAELARHVGLDQEMNETAARYGGGELLDALRVVGTFLNLLVDLGYLRSDTRSPYMAYYPGRPLPPLYALDDRSRRWEVWMGLHARRLRLEPGALAGPGGERFPLVP